MSSAGVLFWLFSTSVLLPGGCSLDKSGLPGVSCASDGDCAAKDDGSPCTDELCVQETCQHVQNSFVPDDQNDCTVDSCDGGQPAHDAAAARDQKCGSQGTLNCDGSGRCGGCTMDSQCPVSTDCQAWTCDLGTTFCEPSNALPGTPAADPSPGDCRGKVCNGNGATKDKLDEAGTACSMNGGTFCDSVGKCIKCQESCTGGNCKKCDGASCVDAAECASQQCVDAVCCATACSGDCQVCGSTGQCESVPLGVSDPDSCPAPGKACDSAGVCKTKDGASCTGNDQCVSGACAGGLCRVATGGACTDSVACATNRCVGSVCVECSSNPDCPGSQCSAPTCLSTFGSPCSLDSDCFGGKCRNSLCRKDIGDLCGSGLECVTERCFMNACAACAGNGDCAGPLPVCEAVNGVMTCLLQINAYCSENAQCASHMCVGFPGHCL